MDSTLRIRTPEGVVFSYALAGPVTRALAVSVDVIVVLVAIVALMQMMIPLAIISADSYAAAQALGYFTLWIGYGVALEWAWKGRTIGKRIFRLRVMDAAGLRLTFPQILTRNLLRFVDMLPGFYLLGGVVMMLNGREQRLGDLAANTVVVHVPKTSEPDLEQLFAGKFNSLRQHPHLAARLRQHVSPEEARLALQAIVRREEFEPAARVRLFEEMAAHFRALVVFPPESVESVPDEQYVRNVVDVLFRKAA